jgi:hypothetical protein
MKRGTESGISIWWFIGALLSVYGILILGQGILEEFVPIEKNTPVLHELRPTLWWGALLLAIGAFYTIRFWPWRSRR